MITIYLEERLATNATMRYQKRTGSEETSSARESGNLRLENRERWDESRRHRIRMGIVCIFRTTMGLYCCLQNCLSFRLVYCRTTENEASHCNKTS
jgi:hypothetical protein